MTIITKYSVCKIELWFLQTHLTSRESRILKTVFRREILNHVTIKNLLEQIIPKEERRIELATSYEKFCFKFNDLNNFNDNKNKLISKFELEFLMKKQIHEYAPLALQFLGSPEILKKPCVAIIGSRHPTFYGREQTFRFAKELSAKGCTIISGGAIGIDSIANSVALEQEGGSCAILGSGLNNLYPPSNFFLFNNLKESPHGLILSEFLEKEPPQKWNFPKRNHTIAQLADFVLIIEAALTSGSLITANAALDYGTDVGAIPGGIDCSNSEGTNLLIKNGAYCIQNPQDVIERVKYIHSLRKTPK